MTLTNQDLLAISQLFDTKLKAQLLPIQTDIESHALLIDRFSICPKQVKWDKMAHFVCTILSHLTCFIPFYRLFKYDLYYGRLCIQICFYTFLPSGCSADILPFSAFNECPALAAHRAHPKRICRFSCAV